MDSEKNNWLNRTPIPFLPWLTTEVLFFTVIILVAIVTRFYDLDARVMSHDESLHTYFSWTFSQGQGYQHNPMMHGPLQFHLLALIFFIFGSSDFTARIPAALFSIATVWALWYWRRYLGRAGAIAAAIMMVISPYMLYYGRYVRNEAFVALYGVLTLYAVLRYLETGFHRYLYLLTASLVLHFTVKETAFIYSAELLIFLAAYLIAQITRKPWEETLNDYRGFVISLMVGIVGVGSALTIYMLNKSKDALNAAQTLSPAIPNSGASPLAPIQSGTSAVVVLAVIGLLAIGAAVFFALRGYGLERIRRERSFDMLMLIGTLILPMLTAFLEQIGKTLLPNLMGSISLMDYSWPNGILMALAFLIPVGILSILLGLWWNRDVWWKAALLHYSIFIVFYTSVFTNGAGFFTGIVGSLGYWIEQQGVQRGSQPMYYYTLIQIPVYEFLPALAAILAFILGAWQIKRARQQPDEVSENLPNTFALLGWWSFASLLAFSVAGERMPWLTVHITLPFILFGGWAIGVLIERIDWEELRRHNALLIVTLTVIFIASLAGFLVSLTGSPLPFSGTELNQLQATTSFVFSLTGAIASGYGLFRLLQDIEPAQTLSLNLLVIFGFLAVLTARASVRANYIDYNSGKEYLVYAHGFTGVKDVLNQVMELSDKTTGTPYNIVVAYDDDVSWPMSWYMRNFPNARFYGASPDMTLREDPVIIVGDNNFSKIEPIVGDNFYRLDYIRMVWPNQDYFNLVSDRPDPQAPFPDDYACNGILGVFRLIKNKDYGRLCNALGNPEMRAAIFDIWLNRDYTRYAKLTGSQSTTDANWDPSDRMRLYVRKDVADLIWSYGIKAAEAQPDPYAAGMKTYSADLMIGTNGSEPGQFNAPRGIAFGPDGTFYVADSRNNRIQHFDGNGTLLNAWGSFADISKGDAPLGTFNEPWGVAAGPDGSVYVTDTWNHRVQKFTKDGKPLKAWGVFALSDTPNALYGPRGISVDASGRIFVADTGNKRIVIYDADGNVLGQFGAEGYQPGEFSEPVDVKVDTDGNAYVTDTWNQRIQKFSPLADGVSYTPTAQWPVKGWKSQSLDNKPFLALSAEGNLFVTDPEGYRVIEFDSQGNFVQLWGTFGADGNNFGLPSGIAVDSLGSVWVTDAANGRVMRFQLPKN